MKTNDAFFEENIRDVFSLVPSDVALSASREVIARYEDGANPISSAVIWCDFRHDGTFSRAGVSDVATMETRSILSPKADPVIQEVVSYADHHGLRVGMLTASQQNGGFHWCIPYTPPSQDAKPKGGFRTLLITENLFREVFDLFNIETQLTPGEKRCVYQVVSGLKPNDAAEVDGVSVETKRSHLKRAMSKLQCASQSELMRMMISQLIHVIYLCESETSGNRVIEAFTMDHLHGSIRLLSQRLPNGRLQRVWEMGPVDGKPLLLLHGVLFPFLLLNAQEQLERLGIRLVVPVRQGYLEDQTKTNSFDEGSVVAQTLEDLEEFIRLTWRGPINVLCHSSGSFLGMYLSQRCPDLISRIVAVSVNLAQDNPEEKTYAASFFSGIRKLSDRTGIHSALVKQFQKTTFSNGAATRFVLRRLFKECATDLDVLNGVLGAGEAFSWYQAMHATSMVGIASDFRMVYSDPGEAISKIRVPTFFLHGPDDGFTSPDLVRAYTSGNDNVSLEVLPVGGHLVAASHPLLFWTEVDAIIR